WLLIGGEHDVTKKTLAELRAWSEQLMHSPLLMHHEGRIAGLAAERNAGGFARESLTPALERHRRERDEAGARVARGYPAEKCTLDPQTCKEAECFACSVLMCPRAEPMHLHHDGCPACHGAALAKARGEEE